MNVFLVFLLITLNILHTFSGVSNIDFEEVNVYWGALSCVNIITQSLKMTRCYI